MRWILLLFFAAFCAAAENLSSPTDLAALYSLRSSLALRARDWPRKTNPCAAWTGVSCLRGRVAALSISGLRRTRLGALSPRFAVDGLRNLSALTAFNVTNFPLPGTIPDWLGTTPPLSVLVLHSASVTGSIPSPLATAASLSVIDLANNSLTGDIPRLRLGNLTLLDLSGNRLSGPIPPLLGDAVSLTRLDLSSNSLSGPLPDDLTGLRKLQSLDLSGNSLSGTLSDTLFSRLTGIVFVELSRNSFSGSVPDSLWTLRGLLFLDVSGNNLTGALPDQLPAANGNVSGSVFNISNNLYYGSVSSAVLARFQSVDLSGNYFQGSPPAGNVTLESNCFRIVSSQRSPADCQQFYAERSLPYDVPGASPPTSPSHKKIKWSVKYILIGVFAGIVVLGVFVLLIVLCLTRRGAASTEQRATTANAAPPGSAAPVSTESVNLSAVGDSYTYEQLLRATAEFNETNLIKHGHSGDLYRGVLEDGSPIVVKRIDVRVVKREAHRAELDFFNKASHPRVVPFLGHCLDNENEKLLVYKYMRHGDLSSALYRKPVQDEEGLQSLDWITRLKIATGVAEALCFLHHECTPPLVHRDIQASSVLLDDKFEVRLGSLSTVCQQEGDGHQNVISRFLRLSSQSSDQSSTGSPAPTCAYDVYCLGKVLLELVTGKLGISGSNDASTNEWLDLTLPYININEKELVTKIVDPSLIVDEDLLEEVWAMAIVARSCLNPKPSKRPLVRYILKALENPLKVVRDESNSSSARLRATSSHGSWNAALFGSWRHSSSDNIQSSTGHPRDDRALKRSGTMRSQGSGGDRSFSFKKPCKEIFPEPSGARDVED